MVPETKAPANIILQQNSLPEKKSKKIKVKAVKAASEPKAKKTQVSTVKSAQTQASVETDNDNDFRVPVPQKENLREAEKAPTQAIKRKPDEKKSKSSENKKITLGKHAKISKRTIQIFKAPELNAERVEQNDQGNLCSLKQTDEVQAGVNAKNQNSNSFSKETALIIARRGRRRKVSSEIEVISSGMETIYNPVMRVNKKVVLGKCIYNNIYISLSYILFILKIFNQAYMN